MAQGIYSSGESPHGHRSGSLDIMTGLEDGNLGREQDRGDPQEVEQDLVPETTNQGTYFGQICALIGHFGY